MTNSETSCFDYTVLTLPMVPTPATRKRSAHSPPPPGICALKIITVSDQESKVCLALLFSPSTCPLTVSGRGLWKAPDHGRKQWCHLRWRSLGNRSLRVECRSSGGWGPRAKTGARKISAGARGMCACPPPVLWLHKKSRQCGRGWRDPDPRSTLSFLSRRSG